VLTLGAAMETTQTRKTAPDCVQRLAALDWRTMSAEWIKKLLGLIVSFAILLTIWTFISSITDDFPGPSATWEEAKTLLADPFYDAGPNDMGIGWNVLYSLKRVGIGFGFAALIGIPMGFIIGRFSTMNRIANPIVNLLRPVSPLAWLPLGLYVFEAADPSAIWVIFICSIWPMILNTAEGVRNVPKDYLNVARVLNLSEWQIATKILFPATLPNILTGVKLAVGTAWLVIVAAEMLTGGIGIGFWLWDEWNNLKIESIIIAIFIIGIVGLLLEQVLMLIARKFAYEKD
jgi:nitrate/nitrite transport system permease protein